MKKYIIRYNFTGFDMNQWCYSTRIGSTATASLGNRHHELVTKMTLKEAEENVIKIKKIHTGKTHGIKEIQIIDIKKDTIMIIKPEEVTRFEIMDI